MKTKLHNFKLKLFLLDSGETLEAKAVELATRGIGIANMGQIALWIEKNPETKDIGPIVIADPLSKLRRFNLNPAIIQVPAHAFDERKRFFPDGWIDLAVPMAPKEAGGQLAILGIVS